ncbi:unnamed protein product [marine sediment metagenome]|uniref:Uncharacterized protein n=1 Tax=marine sediment metagenome TaxID=412755 RepID=X1MUC0_9ZZZZ
MTEFEKYWKKLEPKFYPDSAANDKDKVRWGWEAALEWVLKNLDKIYNGDFENSEIMNTIKKELGRP